MMRPLIFIHEGNQKYLKTAIRCAKEHGNEVYLIGDKSNASFCDNWCAIDDLDKKAYEEFCKDYIHMSTNPHWFELICFKRFFLLSEFAKTKQIEEFIMCDSDLLVFSNLSQFNYSGCDVAVSYCEEQKEMAWFASAHCSFWTINALKKFIDYFVDVYKNQQDKLLVKWNYHQEQKINGGICDMTLLWLWINADDSVKVKNTAQIDSDNKVFDHIMYSADSQKKNEFEMEPKLKCKKVVFEKGVPYFLQVKNKVKIQALTLHAQGHGKRYISALYKRKNTLISYYISMMLYKFQGLSRKIRGVLGSK